MAKQKNPLFSLGAKGTIADTLTHQQRLGEAIVRTKPTPTGPKTLQQAYQRWLYEDYLYLWSQQTEAERLIWRQEAAKTHNTQLGTFMKDRLTNQPGIIGMWRLDERTGISARDSSLNENDGVIYGAQHITGIIDHALYFDGSDDRVDLGNSVIFDMPENCTFEFGLRVDDFSLVCTPFSWGVAGDQLFFHVSPGGLLYFQMRRNGTYRYLSALPNSYQEGIWSSIVIVKQGTTGWFIIDGEDRTDVVQTLLVPNTTTQPLLLGRRPTAPWNWMKGGIDNFTYLNYSLPVEEAIKHSLRRYP